MRLWFKTSNGQSAYKVCIDSIIAVAISDGGGSSYLSGGVMGSSYGEDGGVGASGDVAGAGASLEMECEIDPKDWREEVERVLPSLKVTVRADNKVSQSSICF